MKKRRCFSLCFISPLGGKWDKLVILQLYCTRIRGMALARSLWFSRSELRPQVWVLSGSRARPWRAGKGSRWGRVVDRWSAGADRGASCVRSYLQNSTCHLIDFVLSLTSAPSSRGCRRVAVPGAMSCISFNDIRSWACLVPPRAAGPGSGSGAEPSAGRVGTRWSCAEPCLDADCAGCRPPWKSREFYHGPCALPVKSDGPRGCALAQRRGPEPEPARADAVPCAGEQRVLTLHWDWPLQSRFPPVFASSSINDQTTHLPRPSRIPQSPSPSQLTHLTSSRPLVWWPRPGVKPKVTRSILSWAALINVLPHLLPCKTRFCVTRDERRRYHTDEKGNLQSPRL